MMPERPTEFMSHVVGERPASRVRGAVARVARQLACAVAAPVVLAFDADGQLVQRGAAAEALLADLAVAGADGRPFRIRVRPAQHGDHAADASCTYVVVERLPPDDAEDGAAALAARVGLSPREHEILRGVARGDATKAIARALGISAHTVQEYVGRACRKAGVRTRRELVARLLEPNALG